jgi:hypothetical protein
MNPVRPIYFYTHLLRINRHGNFYAGTVIDLEEGLTG